MANLRSRLSGKRSVEGWAPSESKTSIRFSPPGGCERRRTQRSPDSPTKNPRTGGSVAGSIVGSRPSFSARAVWRPSSGHLRGSGPRGRLPHLHGGERGFDQEDLTTKRPWGLSGEEGPPGPSSNVTSNSLPSAVKVTGQFPAMPPIGRGKVSTRPPSGSKTT